MLRETLTVISVSQLASRTGQKQGPERVREMEAKGHLCGEADRALEKQGQGGSGKWRLRDTSVGRQTELVHSFWKPQSL